MKKGKMKTSKKGSSSGSDDTNIISVPGALAVNTSAANRRYYARILDIGANIAALCTDELRPDFSKFIVNVRGGLQDGFPSEWQIYIILAKNGATFTPGETVISNNIKADLNTCINQPFSVTLGKTFYNDVIALYVAGGSTYRISRPLQVNLLPAVRKWLSKYQSGINNPEFWICISQANILAATTNANYWYSYKYSLVPNKLSL